MDLHDVSNKHLREFFEVKPIFDELGIEPTKDIFSDKPDIRFCFEGKNIGLETTRCYPTGSILRKGQNKYELGDKGVRSILQKYKSYKESRGEWVSLYIRFWGGIYYILRDASLKRQEIERITCEVIDEIETRIKRGHYYRMSDAVNNRKPYDVNYKYTKSIEWDEPQEGMVILGYDGGAKPAKTIEIDAINASISDKEEKLKSYLGLSKNQEMDEYWLCINLPTSSERFFFDLQPMDITSDYTRIYLTQFTDVLRIK